MLVVRRVDDAGRVMRVDLDSIKLGIAANEAPEVGARNVEFREANVFELSEEIGEIASIRGRMSYSQSRYSRDRVQHDTWNFLAGCNDRCNVRHWPSSSPSTRPAG